MRASEAIGGQLRDEVSAALGAGEPKVKRFEAAIVEVPAAVSVVAVRAAPAAPSGPAPSVAPRLAAASQRTAASRSESR